MDADNLPIDIHCSKLLDWLINRRHCGNDWQKKVLTIREKINHAIQDMPEHEKIVQLLQGAYINYFHCTQIVDILKDTEKDSKNFLGYYSSQRMKDWQEVISLYQSDAVYLAEAAQLLQRLVQYEIPALRKQIVKCNQSVEDASRKEVDYEKQSKEARRNFEKECGKMGIRGDNMRVELVQLAADLPAFFDRVAGDIKALQPALDYYANFRKYILKSSTAESSLLPVLHLISKKGAQVTAFELKHGRVPSAVEAPSFGLVTETTQEDVIDFGDDAGGDIDFGADEGIVDLGDQAIDIAVVGDDTNDGQVDDGVARGEDALSVFENHSSQLALMNDLNELKAFLRWRLMDEKTEHTSDLLLSGRETRDSTLSISQAQLDQLLGQVQAVLTAVNDPQKRHLFKIRASPRYVESLAESLEQKRSFEGKYRRMKELMQERQQELSQEAAETQQKLQLLLPSAKELQKQIEAEISKKYKGRPVVIMAGVASATA